MVPANQPVERPTSSTGKYIGKDAAKAKALAHAGVSAGDVRELKCELDRDDGIYLYEVEFEVGRTEYEYDIDAYTGAILKADWEVDD